MIVFWVILLAQPFLVMAIKKFISKDEFYYYVSLLAVEFGILMLVSLLVLFHNVVSKNYICKNTDVN